MNQLFAAILRPDAEAEINRTLCRLSRSRSRGNLSNAFADSDFLFAVNVEVAVSARVYHYGQYKHVVPAWRISAIQLMS